MADKGPRVEVGFGVEVLSVRGACGNRARRFVVVTVALEEDDGEDGEPDC